MHKDVRAFVHPSQLQRKYTESQSAAERRERETLEFLKGVEEKSSKRESELAVTRTKLLTAEAALSELLEMQSQLAASATPARF